MKFGSLTLDMHFDDWGRQTRGDRIIKDSLQALVKNDNKKLSTYITKACWHIRDALPLAISIDNFIDAHRDNEKIAICGKLAIVRSILDAEKNSLLYTDIYKKTDLSYHDLENTWYLSFFQVLTENCETKDLYDRFESIALVIFNYDRCVEHFLYHALQNYYKISKEESAELVKQINIYHPYGSVGSLPWYENGALVNFGYEPNSKQLMELSKKIKTFTEGTDPEESEIELIQSHLSQADKIVFLGFAFHKLNMQIITSSPAENKKLQRKCYATTFGISDSDKEVIRKQIRDLFHGTHPDFTPVDMGNLTCHDFFSHFWRSLAF
jgi:hypothetical protein